MKNFNLISLFAKAVNTPPCKPSHVFLSILMLLAMLMPAKVWGETETRSMYVIGQNTEVGWTNSDAFEMFNDGNGHYSWTGLLKVNSDDGVKFLCENRDWNPAYTAHNSEVSNKKVTVEIGHEYKLQYHPDDTYPDNKFMIRTLRSGDYWDWYRIDIDLSDKNNGKITFNRGCPEKLYLVGSGASINWAPGSAQKLTANNGVLWGKVNFSQTYSSEGTTRDFKFLLEQKWGRMVGSLEGITSRQIVEVASNTIGYNLALTNPDEGGRYDAKFKIATSIGSGYYNMVLNYVDFDKPKMFIFPLTIYVDVNGVTTASTSFTDANGDYVFSGLNIPAGGTYKFCLKSDGTSTIGASANNTVTALNDAQDLVLDGNNVFKAPADKKITGLKLNLATLEMEIVSVEDAVAPEPTNTINVYIYSESGTPKMQFNGTGYDIPWEQAYTASAVPDMNNWYVIETGKTDIKGYNIFTDSQYFNRWNINPAITTDLYFDMSGADASARFEADSNTPAYETLTSDYYLRGDLWLDKNGWISASSAAKFVKAADGKSATIKVLMPNFKVRIALFEGSTQKAPKDYWDASASNITNNNASLTDASKNSEINALGGTKIITYTLTKVNGKLHLAAQASDYTVKKDGWKLYVDGNLVGTTDANGEIVATNLSGATADGGTQHLFYFTDGSASSLRFGINQFGGLYVDEANSESSILSLKQYYKSSSIEEFLAPIASETGNNGIGCYDATGRIKLTANTNVKFTFDGGKITINKVAPAVVLTGDFYVFGAGAANWVTGWSSVLPKEEYKMAIVNNVASKTFYNVSAGTSQFKVRNIYTGGQKDYVWADYDNTKPNAASASNCDANNICLSLSSPSDVTVYCDGVKVWAKVVAKQTITNTYCLSGSFQGAWSNNDASCVFTPRGNYDQYFTKRIAANAGFEYKVFKKGTWEEEFNWNNIVLENCVKASEADVIEKKNSADIHIKPAQLSDVTFHIWTDGSGNRKIDIQIVAVQMQTVKFYDGDTEYEALRVSVEKGTKATKPADPTKSGNIFRGWSETKGGEVVDITTITINADKSFYAKWEAAEVQNIIFHSNYGSEVANLVVVKGEKATKPADPTKAHCTFRGWYENADFTGSEFDWANTNINADYELYAKWEYTGSTKHYLVGTFMGCSNWGDCLGNAIEMTKNGDHLEATLPQLYKKSPDTDLRFKINRGASNNWDNSLKWSDFSSSRSTGTIATYQSQGDNIQVNLTGEGVYRVNMCYDGVSVYAIITEVETHTVTYQNGLLSTTREVEDGEKATALSMAHRGVDVDWYDNEACTGATFDFNTPITASKTLYAKSKGASGNYYLTGAIWHNWTNENKTPQMTVENGVASYTFIAPVGQNTIRTLKGSRSEGDYIDARYFDAANSSEGINMSGDYKQLYFTISDKPKQVTVTFDGAIRVQIEDYTPHFVDNLFLTANGDWCEVWQANGTKVKTGGWDKRKEANKLRQNGTTGYVILRNVQTGDRLWKLIGNIDDDSRSGEQLFNAMYVDYANSVSAAGNYEWNMTDCTPLNRQLSYENDAWRNVRFNVKKVCQLKIVFDGGLIRVMDLPQYTVTFNTNGGSAIDAKTVYEEERVSAPATPTKPLYKFVKWQLNGEDFDFANTPITDNITLDAVYELVDHYVVGPLWLKSSDSNYSEADGPKMTTTSEGATLELTIPKGNQTFGILTARNFDDKYQVKPVADTENSYGIEGLNTNGMYFHFYVPEISRVQIKYSAEGKVSVRVIDNYVKKDGWYLMNFPFGDNTENLRAMDANGELIVRNIPMNEYNFKISNSFGDGNNTDQIAINGITRFGGPFVEMDASAMWKTQVDGAWGQKIAQQDNFWKNAHVHIDESLCINGKGDVKFAFDGKKITVTFLPKKMVTCKLAADGETFAVQPAFQGNIATAPTSTPGARVSDGAAFIEWRLEGATTAFDWNTPITEDITLVAFWDVLQDRANDAIANSETLTLTHDYEGGNLVVSNNLTINGNGHTIGNLTVETTGKLTLSGELTVNDFIVKTDAAEHSSQVMGIESLTINGNAYLDVMYIGSETRVITVDEAEYWYELSAPFAFSVTNGIYRTAGDKMRSGVDYEIWSYDGVKRASTGSGWKRASGTIPAAETFIIGFNAGEQNTIRLKADAKSFGNISSLNLGSYSSSNSGDANWNALGNPNFQSVKLAAPVCVFDNTNHKFFAYDAEAKQPYVIGTPLFVQQDGGSVAVSAVSASVAAPTRAQMASSDDIRFCVQILKEGAARMDDQIFVKASAAATTSYEEGADMMSLNGSSTCAALLWTSNYGMHLAIEEAPLADEVNYDLGIAAPKAGEYTLRVAAGDEDAELYLTLNGTPIWCLSESEYTLSLPKGITSEYGLMIQHAPKVATELTNGQVEGTSARKLWYNGQVFILRDGQVYDATGRMVK